MVLIQCLYNGLADTNPYAVFVSISMTSPFIFLLVPTSSYTVAGSACELGLDDSLDLLEMQQRTEATNTPREKDTTKVTETDTPTAVPIMAELSKLAVEPTAGVQVSALRVHVAGPAGG